MKKTKICLIMLLSLLLCLTVMPALAEETPLSLGTNNISTGRYSLAAAEEGIYTIQMEYPEAENISDDFYMSFGWLNTPSFLYTCGGDDVFYLAENECVSFEFEINGVESTDFEITYCGKAADIAMAEGNENLQMNAGIYRETDFVTEEEMLLFYYNVEIITENETVILLDEFKIPADGVSLVSGENGFDVLFGENTLTLTFNLYFAADYIESVEVPDFQPKASVDEDGNLCWDDLSYPETVTAVLKGGETVAPTQVDSNQFIFEMPDGNNVTLICDYTVDEEGNVYFFVADSYILDDTAFYRYQCEVNAQPQTEDTEDTEEPSSFTARIKAMLVKIIDCFQYVILSVMKTAKSLKLL